MKAFEITAFGLDGLKPTERSEPEALGPYDVLVKLKAASLNYRDLMMAKGEYNPRQPLPLVPLSDGSGEVLSVGLEVTQFQAGDKVASIVVQGWQCGELTKNVAHTTVGGPIDGMLCEQRVFPESALVKVPDYLSFEEAACLPCAGLTAWRALFSVYNLRPGETVLLQGTGGVSLFALQFAKSAGARVVMISSSNEKLEKAKKLGCDIGINYREQPNWSKGLQVDLVLELGGASTISESTKAVKHGGQINLIGRLGGGNTDINLVPIFMRHIRMQGLLVGPRSDFEAMNQAFEQNQWRPMIDKVFDFDQSVDAFRYLESAQHMGKVVIKI